MKTPKNAIWKFVVLMCMITLPACQLRAPRDQEPSPSATHEPVPANPILPSPTAAPTSDDPAVIPLTFVTGRNDYVITVDNTPRKFIVHVPGGYDPSRRTPVVVIFHGSNQNGNLMYENSGWVDKAEQENIIIVFPSSWEYFIIRDDRVEEKWNDSILESLTPPGTELKDDVRFVEALMDLLGATFNLDEKRIFATGGSNGGGFVMSRLAMQMNHTFAAFATCGALIFGEVDASTFAIPVPVSLYNVFGSADEKIAELNGFSLPFPFQAEDILNDPNFSQMLQTTTTILGLEMSYTVQSEADFTTFTFNRSLVGADNEYVFRMVRGMGHIYPSGDNNRAGLNVSDLFWEFFMRHSKP